MDPATTMRLDRMSGWPSFSLEADRERRWSPRSPGRRSLNEHRLANADLNGKCNRRHRQRKDRRDETITRPTPWLLHPDGVHLPPPEPALRPDPEPLFPGPRDRPAGRIFRDHLPEERLAGNDPRSEL